MTITIHEPSKIVEVALTNAEQTDEAVKKQLNEVYARYKGTKYTVAVFFSGKRDLHEETRSLLLFNRRRAAEKAVQAQKAVGSEHSVYRRGQKFLSGNFFATCNVERLDVQCYSYRIFNSKYN